MGEEEDGSEAKDGKAYGWEAKDGSEDKDGEGERLDRRGIGLSEWNHVAKLGCS